MSDENAFNSDSWTELSLTHVEYQKGDSLGRLCAITSLLPVLIVIMFLSVFVVQRDLHTVTYGVGTILNYVINIVLKKIIKEPRPVLRDERKIWQEYGMPSTHSQFMWFVCGYMVLFVVKRLHHQGGMMETLWKASWCTVNVAAAAFVAYGRVYLQYHTYQQVLWGAFAGVLCACVWFYLTQKVFTPWFPAIANWKIAEVFLIRDYTNVNNVLWFNYTMSRKAALEASRQKAK